MMTFDPDRPKVHDGRSTTPKGGAKPKVPPGLRKCEECEGMTHAFIPKGLHSLHLLDLGCGHKRMVNCVNRPVRADCLECEWESLT